MPLEPPRPDELAPPTQSHINGGDAQQKSPGDEAQAIQYEGDSQPGPPDDVDVLVDDVELVVPPIPVEDAEVAEVVVDEVLLVDPVEDDEPPEDDDELELLEDEELELLVEDEELVLVDVAEVVVLEELDVDVLEVDVDVELKEPPVLFGSALYKVVSKVIGLIPIARSDVAVTLIVFVPSEFGMILVSRLYL
jgi:hypothetical protein